MDNLFDRFGSVLKDYIDDTELQKQNRAHKKKPADGKPETEQNKTQSKEKVQQQQQQWSRSLWLRRSSNEGSSMEE